MERTAIRAPFDALVLERNVSTGSQVQPGDPIARVVGRDRYWVEATVHSRRCSGCPRSHPWTTPPRAMQSFAFKIEQRGPRERTARATWRVASGRWRTAPGWRGC
ncbi:MAG: HlyD family efflux transporter periplasmic adaptor subunit [Bacteroidetes bacterium]|nr:HlyD family efflux transporter periplasmic adaptor subunit [Bacteroidota bacterium]